MSLEKIFEMLDEEAENSRKELQEKAEIEAKKIIKEAEQETQKLIQKHIEKMDMALRGERARIQIEAELDKKRKIIKAKEEQTSKIFAELEKDIKNIRNNPEAYKKVFKNLLFESLNEVCGNEIIVAVDKKDEKLAKDILREMDLNHKVIVGDVPMGGISLQVDGNRILVFNTFQSRLEKAKKVLKAQLTEVLFGAS